MIGSVLDKYEILQKIGEGGMATVYRGRHTTLGRDVAIKVLHPHLSRSERNRLRFAREARAIEHLDHDNILKIFDYSGTVNEDCYIVTEFVDGVTLQQLISEHGRIPSEVATIIGLHLAEALAYAHGLGIIHRDLKPENVMLRRDGAVKLMDFGIARFLDEVNLTVTGALVGSPAYMSPEQAMERVLDPRSDLFSLGTLLFHLVTGQLPFSGNNPSIILRNIIEGNRQEVMELAPDISGSFADLVEQLLQVSVNDRPADARAVRDRLRAVLDEVGIDPEQPNWGLKAWLMDPPGYQERLVAQLATVLIAEGRRRLDTSDHLGALRLFNRLLSLDENNEEVLTLVQEMHTAGTRTSTNRRWWVAGLVSAGLAAVTTWVLWPDAPPPGEQGTGNHLVQGEPGVTTGDAAPPPSATRTPAPPEDTPPSEPAEAAAEPDARPQVARITQVVTPAPTRTRTRTPPQDRVDAAAEPPAGAATEPGAPGLVSVAIQGGVWGEIYIDDVHKGRTGQVERIPVTPGRHVLRLDNDLALPFEQDFEVASGQHLILTPELTKKPATAIFQADVPGDCVVQLDGVVRGTVGALGGRLEIPSPGPSHMIGLDCGNGPMRDVLLDHPLPGSTMQVGMP